MKYKQYWDPVKTMLYSATSGRKLHRVALSCQLKNILLEVVFTSFTNVKVAIIQC